MLVLIQGLFVWVNYVVIRPFCKGNAKDKIDARRRGGVDVSLKVY